MGMSSIPVDLGNPGQVFACLGLLEAADMLCGPAEGRFNWDELPCFELRVQNEINPLETVINFLSIAKITAISPDVTGLIDCFGIATRQDGIFTPSSEPKSSVLPIELEDTQGNSIRISHWAETNKNGLDNVKFWGGAAGYSAAARMRDLQQAYLSIPEHQRIEAINTPFDLPAKLSIGFRLEMRRDYTAIDVGFSPNDHKSTIQVVGYPLVEMLAVIGLENARPKRINRYEYRYAAWGEFLPPMLARPALGMGGNFSLRRFSMHLVQANRGGDRAISFTSEEFNYVRTNAYL